jgi:hypothetical protein
VRSEKRKSTTSLLASAYSTRAALVSTSSFMLSVALLAAAMSIRVLEACGYGLDLSRDTCHLILAD